MLAGLFGSSGDLLVDSAWVLGSLSGPGTAGGGQDGHGQQDPECGGGGVGDGVGGAEAGPCGLRRRSYAYQQGGPGWPVPSGQTPARGPAAERGGEPRCDQPGGWTRMPGRGPGQAAPAQVLGRR